MDHNSGNYESMRSKLAKRYSIPLKENEPTYHKPEPEPVATVSTARHYRGEVEARRKMLEA